MDTSLAAMGYFFAALFTGLFYRDNAGDTRGQAKYQEQVPLTEWITAGVLWPLVIPFTLCIGLGHILVRVMRLGPKLKDEVNSALKGSHSTAVIIHDRQDGNYD